MTYLLKDKPWFPRSFGARGTTFKSQLFSCGFFVDLFFKQLKTLLLKSLSLSKSKKNEMRLLTSLVFLVFMSDSLYSQPTLEKVLKDFNSETVPYITIDSLLTLKNAVLLDAREPEEYNVSHIKDAIFVGYNQFKIKKVTQKITDKNTPIVVYCSIGVRSEDIGERLLKKGYTNVLNLYGGIFEWKKKSLQVFNKEGKATQKVHACSKYWGQLLTNAEKVY